MLDDYLVDLTLTDFKILYDSFVILADCLGYLQVNILNRLHFSRQLGYFIPGCLVWSELLLFKLFTAGMSLTLQNFIFDLKSLRQFR